MIKRMEKIDPPLVIPGPPSKNSKGENRPCPKSFKSKFKFKSRTKRPLTSEASGDEGMYKNGQKRMRMIEPPETMKILDMDSKSLDFLLEGSGLKPRKRPPTKKQLAEEQVKSIRDMHQEALMCEMVQRNLLGEKYDDAPIDGKYQEEIRYQPKAELYAQLMSFAEAVRTVSKKSGKLQSK